MNDDATLAMAQNRYIMNFLGKAPLPEDDVQLIKSKSHLLDTSRKSLLVEVAEDDTMQELISKLPNWTATKEASYPIPSTRPTIRKPPK